MLEEKRFKRSESEQADRRERGYTSARKRKKEISYYAGERKKRSATFRAPGGETRLGNKEKEEDRKTQEGSEKRLYPRGREEKMPNVEKEEPKTRLRTPEEGKESYYKERMNGNASPSLSPKKRGFSKNGGHKDRRGYQIEGEGLESGFAGRGKMERVPRCNSEKKRKKNVLSCRRGREDLSEAKRSDRIWDTARNDAWEERSSPADCSGREGTKRTKKRKGGRAL